MREQLKKKRKQQPLECKEWGDGLFIRKLSVGERIQCEKLSKDTLKMFCFVMIASIVNKDGEQQLTEEDEALLEEQDGEAVTQIMDQVMRFNGMSKDVHEDNVKNSANDQPSPSPAA